MSDVKKMISDIGIGIQNIDNLLQDPKLYGICSDSDIKGFPVYDLIHSIDACYQTAVNVGALSVFDKGIDVLLSNAFSILDSKNDYIAQSLCTQFLLAMLAHAASASNFWFFRALRDDVMEWSLAFNRKTTSYFWLTCIYLFSFSGGKGPADEDKTFDDLFSKKINEFLNEPPKPKNGFLLSTWKEKVIEKFNLSRSSEAQITLRDMLDFYDVNIQKFGFLGWYNPMVKEFQVVEASKFNKGLLIRCWLTLLLNRDGISLDYGEKGEKSSLLDCLTKEEQQDFFRVLDGSENVEDIFDQTFLNFYGIQAAPKEFIMSTSGFKSISDFRQNIVKAKLFEQNKMISSDVASAQANEKKLMKESFEAGLMKMGLCEADKSTRWYRQLSIDFTIDQTDDAMSQLFKILQGESFEIIQKKIYEDARALDIYRGAPDKRAGFTESDLAKIKNFISQGPCHLSGRVYLTDFAFSISSEDFALVKKPSINENFRLPRLFYYRDEGLSVHMNYSDIDSFVEPLSEADLLPFIDKSFKQKNGLYLFKRYQNDPNSVFLTKEEMLDTAKKRYFKARIVLDYEFIVDPNNLLVFYKG
jgi:hypothetical protein